VFEILNIVVCFWRDNLQKHLYNLSVIYNERGGRVMKLLKIKYRSAVFFGVFVFISAILQTLFSHLAYGSANAPALNLYLLNPLKGAAVMYVTFMVAICIYNFLSKKGYGFSWEVSKK